MKCRQTGSIILSYLPIHYMIISAPPSTAKDVQRALYLHVSFFCSIIPLFSAAAYILMRTGFEENHAADCIKLTGTAFFLLFLPDISNRILHLAGRGHLGGRWYLCEAILPLYGLLFLFVTGYLALFSQSALFVLPVGLGYIFWIISGISFIRSANVIYLITGLLLTLFFCIWVAALTVRPAMLERIVAGNTEIDFWFHTAMSQMLKTYGIPSSGFDGTPWMYYHYGNHLLTANLSALLKIPVYVMYSVGYAVIIVPLFFKMYLTFAFTARSILAGNTGRVSHPRIGYATAFLFLCIFMQIIKNLYTGLFLGYNFLGSESYTAGLSVMFAICSICLTFWYGKPETGKQTDFSFFFLFLPVALAVLGFLKISLLYLALVIAGYLFFRLGLYKKGYYWLAGFVLAGIGLSVYLATVETTFMGATFMGARQLGYEGRAEPFYFFRHTHPFEPVDFFVFFYLWSHLYCIAFLLLRPAGSIRQLFRSGQSNATVSVELVLLICIAGLVPSFFLLLAGGNAMYFAGFQALFSSALLIAILPLLKEKWNSLSRRSKLPYPFYQVLAVLVSITAYLILYMGVRFKVTEKLGRDFSNRKSILKDTSGEKFNLSESLAMIASGTHSPNQEKFRYLYSPAVQAALERDTIYQFLKKARALDQISVQEKRKTGVYADLQRANLPFRVPCYVVPFLVPGLSGMASVYGMPYDCPMGAYGYEYYNARYKNHPGWDHVFTPQEVCGLAQKWGLGKVIWFSPAANDFKPVTCIEN